MPSVIGHLLDIDRLGERTTAEFRRALFVQAIRAGYNPNYLAAVMAFESGYDPHVQNRGGAPAYGLIQFWKPAWDGAAARLGRVDVPFPGALLSMTAEEQLPFVLAYYDGTPLRRLASEARATQADYYLATFMPALVGAPRDYVLGRRDSAETLRTVSGKSTGLSLGKVYAQNAGLDANRDGVITVGETVAPVEKRLNEAVVRGVLLPVWGEPSELGPAPPALPGAPPPEAPAYLMSSAGLLFFCRSCGARSEVVGVAPVRDESEGAPIES